VSGWFSKLFDRDRSKKKSSSERAGLSSLGNDDRLGRRSNQDVPHSWPARDSADRGPLTVKLSARGKPTLPMIDDPHEAATRLVSADELSAAEVEERNSGNSASNAPTVASPLPSADTASDPDKRLSFAARPEAAADMTRLVTTAHGEENDWVVGWLVIVKGPGFGRSLEIGTGANSIGRGANQKVSLNFGDPKISRERHAILVYEPKSRRFFLQNGEVRNLTYIDDQVVLTPVELTGGETIAVGETLLKFLPFCGPQFGWLE
jgi:hypothetical protein